MSLLAVALPLAATAAEEGKKVITAMLIVGLIFVGVIALGETTHWLRTRRRRGH
jgi:heme/copper-type cytochrome/quinol oxidase subunit 2